MSKKVLIGSMIYETNSFSPIMAGLEDFSVLGPTDYLHHCPVADMFQQAGFDVLPTIGATSLPAGIIEQNCYNSLSDKILTSAEENKDEIVGVWLYIHGAMQVEGLGSAELDIVKNLRRILGPTVPIALAMDFHASLPDEMVDYCDIITSYKTAPHTDQVDTQKRAAELLIRTLQGEIHPRLLMVRIPAIVDGNFVLTEISPQKDIMDTIRLKEKEDIFSITFFACQPWINTPYNSATVFVTFQGEQAQAEKSAKEIALMYWNSKDKFSYYGDMLTPDETISLAEKNSDETIFISDSGDNPTAGAPGDSVFLLSKVLKSRLKNILMIPVVDPTFMFEHSDTALGSQVEGYIGGSITNSKRKLYITAKILHRGNISTTEGLGHSCRGLLIETQGVQIIVTDKRSAFTNPGMFDSFGVDLKKYRVVIFKLGYLFADLQPLPDRSIYSLTPGPTSAVLEDMPFDNISHPLYPFDKDFIFEPKYRVLT